ncbi:pre-mRNA-splicing factor SYF2 [Klebsormidium nitens]|uniref:Pre-mRNA-splicing factor SYF2 n=1 Tax=Klebsormidium nitens TaxID=105231 RepID=A0A1Y1HJY0_KLENI|nr:pre-mRNA-splicing factor SYF2 [Klebsormidium nitens]|eukprot:GAQ77882.1 pre-mRNA-splicing factor SYF2 [Klebsormidium nitens]
MASSRVHPRCRNASNPYHECVEFCFKVIAQQDEQGEAPGAPQHGGPEPSANELPTAFGRAAKRPRPYMQRETAPEPASEEPKQNDSQAGPGSEAPGPGRGEDTGPGGNGASGQDADFGANPTEGMNERQKKLFVLKQKMNNARKLNQTAVVAEKKRAEAPGESRGVSKQKWYDEKKKRLGKELEASGLDMKQAYMLDTVEDAEEKYKKWDKKETPFGWDVFNQKSLYNAYKKRTNDVPYTQEEYEQAKANDPNFYADDSNLQYGQSKAVPQENVDRMVGELKAREEKRKQFSRRRKFHEDKDIDSINERNAHFNRKIERAFGKYTVEIKNNLERGTALPD